MNAKVVGFHARRARVQPADAGSFTKLGLVLFAMLAAHVTTPPAGIVPYIMRRNLKIVKLSCAGVSPIKFKNTVFTFPVLSSSVNALLKER